MTLTKREKFLLFFLAIIAIGISMVMFVILPLQNELNLLKIEKETLEGQKAVIDATIPLLPSLKSSQETKLIEANAELAYIESPIIAAEFERWMLPLTTKYDMQITEVTVKDAVVSEPNGQVVLVNEPIYGLKTLIQGFSGEIDEIDEAPVSTSTLLKMTVDYNLITN